MEITTVELPENYTLYDTGDWHVGPLCCHFEGLHQLINKVAADETGYVILKGDLGDYITPNDKRYAHSSMDFKRLLLTPQEQAEKLVELIRPIRHKVLSSVVGNHEYTNINTFNATSYVCKSLGIHYGAGAVKIRVMTNGKLAHKFFFTHGRGSLPRGAKDPIQREANKKAALKNKLVATGHADCVYMSCGHFHQLIKVDPTISKEIQLVDDGYELQQVRRYIWDQSAPHIPADARFYGCSGSMLKLYCPSGSGAISYGEMAMYGACELGWLEAKIKGGRMVELSEVECGSDMQEAAA